MLNRLDNLPPNKGTWLTKRLAQDQIDTGVTIQGKPTTSKQSIKKAVKRLKWNTWKTNMNRKSTLCIYQYRDQWGKNPWLGADETTIRWIRCRIGDIQLHHRTAHWDNQSDKCSFCPSERETLEHVLVKCPGYQKERQEALERLRSHVGQDKTDEWLAIESTEEQAAAILGITGEPDEATIDIAKELVNRIWEKREVKESDRETQEQTE